MNVYIVSLEWNRPPAEVTGDSGLVGAYWTKADADRAADGVRKQWDEAGEQVYQYSMAPGRYCGCCGEDGAGTGRARAVLGHQRTGVL